MQLPRERAALGAKKAQESINVAAIAFLANKIGARRSALANRVQETRSKAPIGRIIRLDIKFAGSILKHALHERHRTAECMNAGERTKDARAGESLVGRISGDVDPGKLIAHGDGEVWKCLVVAQQFIETRMNVLDQAALQEQRLPLCFAFQNVEISDNIQHGLLSTAQVCAGHEVTGNTVR